VEVEVEVDVVMEVEALEVLPLRRLLEELMLRRLLEELLEA